MKKIIALLCAALILTATACAAPQDPPETTTAPTQTDSTPPTTDPPVTDPPVTDPPATDPPPAHEKFDLVACKILRGTWSTTVTLDAQLLNLQDFEEEVTFELYYSFNKHGYFTAYVDEENFENALDTYEALVVEHMVTMRYHTFKGKLEYTGPTAEEIDAMWADGPEAEARTECENFVATLNLYHRCMKLVREGQYYVEDGKLYTQLSDGAFESSGYTADGSTLTLAYTDNVAVYRPLCIDFPLIFTRCE